MSDPHHPDQHEQRQAHYDRLREQARQKLPPLPRPKATETKPKSDVRPAPSFTPIFNAIEIVLARRNSLRLIEVMTRNGHDTVAQTERSALIADVLKLIEADGYDCAKAGQHIADRIDFRLTGIIRRGGRP